MASRHFIVQHNVQIKRNISEIKYTTTHYDSLPIL